MSVQQAYECPEIRRGHQHPLELELESYDKMKVTIRVRELPTSFSWYRSIFNCLSAYKVHVGKKIWEDVDFSSIPTPFLLGGHLQLAVPWVGSVQELRLALSGRTNYTRLEGGSFTLTKARALGVGWAALQIAAAFFVLLGLRQQNCFPYSALLWQDKESDLSCTDKYRLEWVSHLAYCMSVLVEVQVPKKEQEARVCTRSGFCLYTDHHDSQWHTA